MAIPPTLPFLSMASKNPSTKFVYDNNNDYENSHSEISTPPSRKVPGGIGPSRKGTVGKEPLLNPLNLMKAQTILSRTKNGRNLLTKLGSQTMKLQKLSGASVDSVKTKGAPVTEVNIVCKILGSTKKFKLDLNMYLIVLSDFLNYQFDSETFFESMTRCKTPADKLKVSQDYVNTPYPWFAKDISYLKGGASERPEKRGRAEVVEEEEEEDVEENENDFVAAEAAPEGFGLQNFCSAICPFESEEQILEKNTSLIAEIQSQIGRITTLRPSVLVGPATLGKLRELKEKLVLVSDKKYTTTICQQYYVDAKEDNKSNTSASVTAYLASISPEAVAAREAREAAEAERRAAASREAREAAEVAARARERSNRIRKADKHRENILRYVEATVAREKAERNREKVYGSRRYVGASSSKYGARRSRSRSRSRNRNISTQERKATLWNRAYFEARNNPATFNHDLWGRNPYRGRDRYRRTRRRKT